MDNLQPGDTISNKYGTRKVLSVLPGVVLLNQKPIVNGWGNEISSRHGLYADKWYSLPELQDNGYELTLNDEPEEVDYIYVRERLLEALGGESEESYIDDKAKHLLDNLITVVAEFISLERKDND